jgi:hypothetical protein
MHRRGPTSTDRLPVSRHQRATKSPIESGTENLVTFLIDSRGNTQDPGHVFWRDNLVTNLRRFRDMRLQQSP